ncbi:MAG: hypothetical protein JSS99_14610 [Actinobacteria bacterium]|nr:hypothetical protein [Actinomycetota bacterium]
MSVQSGSSPTYRTDDGVGASSSARYATPDTGYGWVIFAGSMLLIVGVLNTIYGIAAVDNANFFVNGAKYVISDLNTWGWVVLITGVVQILTAFGIWARNTLATWLGIAFACLNGIAQLLMLPAYPLLSIALFGVDVLIVYGLAVHGGKVQEA